ncbi:MAG: hypothetical protein IJ167_01770 [Lachnospiraceae bacterium]|nr:hypothetical protein [Lachnospiraceae bacterium]
MCKNPLFIRKNYIDLNIFVVLIAMVAIFKDQIESLVNNIWKSINKDAKKIYN